MIEENSLLYKILGLKKRYRDDSLDNFPKLYTRGKDVILCANDYWTPRGKVIWDKVTKIMKGLNRLCLAIGVSCLVLGFLYPPLMAGSSTLIISLVLWVLFYTPLGSIIGKILLSKRTALEFFEKKIVIYRHGYGLSFPVSVKIADASELYVDIRETSKSKDSVDQSHDAKLIQRDSRRIELVQGTKRTRVTDVYDEDIGAKIKLGIEAARELRENLAQEESVREETVKREKSAAAIVEPKPDVPETKEPKITKDSRWD